MPSERVFFFHSWRGSIKGTVRYVSTTPSGPVEITGQERSRALEDGTDLYLDLYQNIFVWEFINHTRLREENVVILRKEKRISSRIEHNYCKDNRGKTSKEKQGFQRKPCFNMNKEDATALILSLI